MELILGENRPVVVQVDCHVVAIPLFWVDVPSSS